MHRAKNVEFGKDYLIQCRKARQILLQMLHESVLTDLDPDYTWYEKEISLHPEDIEETVCINVPGDASDGVTPSL